MGAAYNEVVVSKGLARDLLHAVSALPRYENKAYYDLALQQEIHDHIMDRHLDGFGALVNEIRAALRQRPHCVVVKGLDWDEKNRLFVGLNRAFGDLVAGPYEAPRAQLVHYIYPAADLAASGKVKYETENLHTDTADWFEPVALISMVCVRPDSSGGGRSQILDHTDVKERIMDGLGEEALEVLQTYPVPWQIAPYLGGGVSRRKIIDGEKLCWRRYTIDMALDSLGESLPDDLVGVLDRVNSVISPSPREYLMQEGEIMFLDNHRSIHARSPINTVGGCNRLMIRSWIQTH